MLCGHTELCDFAVNKWTERILNRTANPILAMAVADKFGLPKLAGVSYYITLLSCDQKLEWKADLFGSMASDFEDTPTSDTGNQEDVPPRKLPELTASQKIRLLSGFFSLVQLWNHLAVTAPTFGRPDGCTYHAHGCLTTWKSTWFNVARSAAMMTFSPADVVGRLKRMQEVMLADSEIACALTPSCRRAAMGCLKALIRSTKDELATHFVDLTRTECE